MAKVRQLILLALSICSVLVSQSAWAKGSIHLHPTVMRELNQVIRASDRLHVAMVKSDEEQLEIAVRNLIHHIDRVRTVAVFTKQHERTHLLKILEAGREQLEFANSSFGEERQARLLQAYDQLVNLVRIYKVDSTYSIFFCERNKASWVQRGGKALNPFSSIHRSCGVRVPRPG